MKKLTQLLTIFFLASLSMIACQKNMSDQASNNKKACCSPSNKAKNASSALVCKLPSKEMHERKLTVLASLKNKVLEKKELSDGYAFRFEGNDQNLTELTEFIRTERECCSFFTFNLSVSGDKSEIWLELTGVEGAKDFITQELEL
jgi:hypothetical protein